MTVFAAALLGLILGSFYNVCILRYISGESVVAPPSRCPKCLHRLAWRDLIPVVSFLLLRGKCRYCRASISCQYPIVELITAMAYGALAWRYGLSLELAVYMAFLGLLIVLSGIDVKTLRLPDVLTIPGIFLAIPSCVLLLSLDCFDVIGGAILGYAVFRAISVLYTAVRHTCGLGLGDAKLMALIGAFVGISGLPIVMLLASVMGCVFAAKKKQPFAFGPWLSAAAFLQILLQLQIEV